MVGAKRRVHPALAVGADARGHVGRARRRRTSRRIARASRARPGSGRSGSGPPTPKRRIAAGEVVGHQRDVPLAHRHPVRRARVPARRHARRPRASERSRPIPRSGESGGSSGWRARRTPASSADRDDALEEPREARPEPLLLDRRLRCFRAHRPTRRASNAVASRASSRRYRRRRPRPRDDGHPVVTPHADPEPTHRRGSTPGPCSSSSSRPGRPRRSRSIGGLSSITVSRRPASWTSCRRSASGPSVHGASDAWPRQSVVAAREDADGLLDADLAELRPGRVVPRLEQDLGESQHQKPLTARKPPSATIVAPVT